MIYYIEDESGKWVEGAPEVDGQRYRLVDSGGGLLESLWSAQETAYKTNGLKKTDIRKILTDNEQIAIDKAMANVEGDLSWLPTEIDLDSDAEAIGKKGKSYRDVLRSICARYKDADVFDVAHPDYLAGWQFYVVLGLLDGERVADLMKGLPQ